MGVLFSDRGIRAMIKYMMYVDGFYIPAGDIEDARELSGHERRREAYNFAARNNISPAGVCLVRAR